MKYALVALTVLALALSAPAQAVSGRTPTPAADSQNHTGLLYDAGGVWVTAFVLKPGVVVTIPHDATLGNVAWVTTLTGTWIVNLDSKAGGSGGWTIPATAGSSTCWAIPYGPPDPDGTWPVQTNFTQFTGHGDSLYSALADYKEQVAEAIAVGAEPSPGSCN